MEKLFPIKDTSEATMSAPKNGAYSTNDPTRDYLAHHIAIGDSCHGDNNDPEPENVPSEADTPSELNENAITFAAMRSMSASIGSWRSGTSSSSWGAVCDNFPQLRLLLGFLKVNTHLPQRCFCYVVLA